MLASDIAMNELKLEFNQKLEQCEMSSAELASKMLNFVKPPSYSDPLLKDLEKGI